MPTPMTCLRPYHPRLRIVGKSFPKLPTNFSGNFGTNLEAVEFFLGDLANALSVGIFRLLYPFLHR